MQMSRFIPVLSVKNLRWFQDDGVELIHQCSAAESGEVARRILTMLLGPDVTPCLAEEKCPNADQRIVHFVICHPDSEGDDCEIWPYYFRERQLKIKRIGARNLGVIALEDIGIGEIIIFYTGDVRCNRAGELHYTGVKRMHFRTVQGYTLYVDSTRRGNISRYIRHSSEPNTKAHSAIWKSLPLIVIQATLDIPRGTEITFDYAAREE